MAKDKKNPKVDNLTDVESALTQTEQFIEENQKILSIVVGVIVAIVVIYLGFNKFYIQPKEKEALGQMFMAEKYFEKDSFNLALNGDGNYLGFLDIIEEYNMTASANLANYYAGISYLHLGQFDTAIEFLDEFDTDDMLLGPIKEGAKGDANLEMGELEKAMDLYVNAYQMTDNVLTTPIYMMKAASVMESLEKYDDALDIYEMIKEKYPQSSEARNIEKYIARAKVKINS